MTPPAAPTPDISVIVCTFNRADLLRDALTSLLEQTHPPDAYEMLVVNNASTDHTAPVVRDLAAAHPDHTLRLVDEARQGLGYARNTGWRAARADLVAYLDDDAVAPREWVAQLVATFRTVEPTPLGIGGPVDVRYARAKPAWFKDSYEIITWGDEPRWLKPREVLAGGNMAWQRATLAQYGGFDVDKGVSGDRLSLGEETWLFFRVWDDANRTGPPFYYTPALRIYHLVAPIKLSVRYRLARGFVAGQVRGQEAIRERQMTPRQRVNTAIVKTGRLLRRALGGLRRRREYDHWQNWAVEVGLPLAMDWGYVVRLLGITLKVKQR